MEWLAFLIVVLILFGPIAWAVTRGRRSRVSDHEDAQGSTAYGEFVRNVEAPSGQSGPPAGQGS
jgi:hypothetical protein